jgi:hypothetical protein
VDRRFFDLSGKKKQKAERKRKRWDFLEGGYLIYGGVSDNSYLFILVEG